MAVGVGPRFFSLGERRRIGKPFRCDEALKRSQPVLIVFRPVVGFPTLGRRTEFFGKRLGPLFPCEITLFGEPNRHCKRLGLPWFRENRAAFITGQLRQRV